MDNYYDVGCISVLAILKTKMTKEEHQGFLRGNVLKYICRAGHKTKDTVPDYNKALNYLGWLVESYE